MESFRDPFLEEAWQRHAEEERGEPGEEEQTLGIYLDLKTEIAGKPELEEFMESIEKQILRYEATIARFARLELEGKDREDIAQADESRRSAHNALLSDLDILARSMNKAKLDISWRDMVGSNRDEIGNWARDIAPHLRKIVERREKSHERKSA